MGSCLQQCGLCLLLVLVAGPSALAQKSQLTAELKTPSLAVRTDAPIPVEWKLHWQGLGLLEGHLELTIRDGQELLGRFGTHDIVQANGQQSYRTLLPKLETFDPFGQIGLQMVFVGQQKTIDLGTHLIRVPSPWKRSQAICVCDTWKTLKSPGHQLLIDSFRLENFNPNSKDTTLITFPARVEPADLPNDPLGYCVYNIVLLSEAGFAELREKQLKALLQWVDAGGSLYLVPSGILSERHETFLNHLVKSDPDHLPFLLDSSGHLASLDSSWAESRLKTGNVWLGYKGLGRVAIDSNRVPGASGPTKVTDFSSPQWRTMVAFLWKVRSNQVQQIARSGKWEKRLSAMEKAQIEYGSEWEDYYGQYSEEEDPLTLLPIQSGDSLLQELMPDNIQVVPLSLIGFILFLYVLTIGPVDYFLLGFIKQRRLTWIFFPVVTVGFTLFTVWLSHAYMATSGNRKAIVFIDLAEDGSVARMNRFELLFTSTSKKVSTEVHQGIYTPLNHQRFSQYGRFGGVVELVGAASYKGRIPSRYTVQQDIPQWTPQLNRLFTIAPDTPTPDFDFSTVEEQRFHSASDRDALGRRLLQAFGPKTTILLLNGNQVHRMSGSHDILQRKDYYRYGYDDSENFLIEMCVRSPQGLFEIVSQISPTGGDNFEDLTVLDSSDSNGWLLVVMVQRGDDLLVYRKLYPGDS